MSRIWPVLLAAVVSCTTPEAPLPPRVSIAPRTFMVGDTVIMKETVQGVPHGQVAWIGPSGREVVQRMGNGPSFYGSGAGIATIKVQLFDSTGANLIAEDSALLTVVVPPPSNRPAFIQLDASVSRGCGLTAAGEVFCWGNTEMRSFSATCDRPFHQSYSLRFAIRYLARSPEFRNSSSSTAAQPPSAGSRRRGRRFAGQHCPRASPSACSGSYPPAFASRC